MKRLSADPPAARAERPSTSVLHDEPNVRVIAFHLLPGQQVPPHHNASTVLVHVVSGTGTFRGDGAEATLGPGESGVYVPGETHSIHCGDDGPLHFLAILSPRPG
jgi:quercetin dioxygenase-like cupin family protein